MSSMPLSRSRIRDNFYTLIGLVYATTGPLVALVALEAVGGLSLSLLLSL